MSKERGKKKGKNRNIWLSDNLEEIERVNAFEEDKRIGLETFKAIKANDIENENEEPISSLEKVKQNVNTGNEQFLKAFEYCRKHQCITTHGKSKVVVVLLKEEFPEENFPGIKELNKRVKKDTCSWQRNRNENLKILSSSKKDLERVKSRIAKALKREAIAESNAP